MTEFRIIRSGENTGRAKKKLDLIIINQYDRRVKEPETALFLLYGPVHL